MGFFEKLKEQNRINIENQRIKSAERQAKEKAQFAAAKERRAKLDEEGVAYCPRCLSTSITANKKGFGLGKAAIGGVLLGPVGLLGGMVGKNKIKIHCLKCGFEYRA